MKLSVGKRGSEALVSTYTAGAGVALAAVERLILRACSCTLDFASTMEDGLVDARVDLHRARLTFGVAGTRMDLVAGNAILMRCKRE